MEMSQRVSQELGSAKSMSNTKKYVTFTEQNHRSIQKIRAYLLDIDIDYAYSDVVNALLSMALRQNAPISPQLKQAIQLIQPA